MLIANAATPWSKMVWSALIAGKRNSASYMMGVYRQEGDGENYEVMRNVYVPIFVDGKRWGDYELPYAL